jgi:hypothetical protein
LFALVTCDITCFVFVDSNVACCTNELQKTKERIDCLQKEIDTETAKELAESKQVPVSFESAQLQSLTDALVSSGDIILPKVLDKDVCASNEQAETTDQSVLTEIGMMESAESFTPKATRRIPLKPIELIPKQPSKSLAEMKMMKLANMALSNSKQTKTNARPSHVSGTIVAPPEQRENVSSQAKERKKAPNSTGKNQRCSRSSSDSESESSGSESDTESGSSSSSETEKGDKEKEEHHSSQKRRPVKEDHEKHPYSSSIHSKSSSSEHRHSGNTSSEQANKPVPRHPGSSQASNHPPNSNRVHGSMGPRGTSGNRRGGVVRLQSGTTCGYGRSRSSSSSSTSSTNHYSSRSGGGGSSSNQDGSSSSSGRSYGGHSSSMSG